MRQLDRPDDLPRALGAAERAVKADERLIEARFNRALALESLFLEEQARQAWQDYVARDPGSEWANEARSHLEKLQRGAGQRGPQPDLARNNSPPPITDTSVETGLDWLLRHGLPAWADAILAGDVDRAAREHSSLSDYAQQISTTSGDGLSLAAALVDVMSDEPAVRTTRATTIRGFALALAHVEAEDIVAAEAAFASVCACADAPLALLCEYRLGWIDVMRRRDGDAQRRISTVLLRADERRWIYPSNLARRLSGYRLMFRGHRLRSHTTLP